MEKNIKNKKDNSFMKKITLMFLMISILISSGFSAVIYNDLQNETTLNYEDNSLIASSSPALAFNGMSTITYNFVLSSTPMYLLLSASGVNDYENITISYYDSVLSTFINKDYQIPKDDTFILEMTPQDVGDETTLILNNASGNIAYSYVFGNDNDRAIDSTRTIYTPLINSVVSLIEINVSIWKIGYYLLIAGLVLGAIGSLVLLGIKYYNWADNHSIYEKKNTRR